MNNARAERIAGAEASKLAWADVRAAEDAFDTPTALAHGTAATVDDRGGGTRRVVQSPYRFSAASSGVRGGAPHFGEHNAEVLADCGLTTPEIVRQIKILAASHKASL